MFVESVSASNFRNLHGSIKLLPGLNIFLGPNGEGKTNWLEAIFITSFGRSFRTSKLSECIRFGMNTASLRAVVRESSDVTRELGVGVGERTKELFVNGKRSKPNEYLGNLSTVIFNSDELEIIRGGPEARRRFLDEGIEGLHPPFTRVFTDYQRVLKQKNSLLSKAADGGFDLGSLNEALAPWNQQLTELAEKIHRARVRFVDRLSAVLEQQLFSRESVSLRYRSSLEDKGDLQNYAALMSERLELRQNAEIAAGHSLIGPHRDDLEILFDGKDMRKFGSSGQQRSALLVLLLAGIEVFNSTRGEYPVFLIDDIDAELDYRRIGKLLEYLDGRTQTIVTTSKESLTERFGSGANIILIEGGGGKTAG